MAKLIVEVLDASDLMPKDGQGSASPFVEVDFDEQRQRTQTKTKNLNPQWNEKLVFNLKNPKDLENQTISVYVYNDQRQGHHKNFLGRVRISGASVPFSDSESSVQRYPLDKRGIFSHIKGDIGLKIYAFVGSGGVDVDGRGGENVNLVQESFSVETEQQNVNFSEDRATPFSPLHEINSNKKFEEQFMKETETKKKKKKEPEFQMANSKLSRLCMDDEDPMLHVRVRCKHGQLLPLQTSWSKRNPGRRFWSCPFYGESSCKFFRWRDDEIDARSKLVVPRLLNKLKELEEGLAEYQCKKDKWMEFEEEYEKAPFEDEVKIKKKGWKVLPSLAMLFAVFGVVVTLCICFSS